MDNFLGDNTIILVLGILALVLLLGAVVTATLKHALVRQLESKNEELKQVNKENTQNIAKKKKDPNALASAKAFTEWVSSWAHVSALFLEDPTEFLKTLDEILIVEKGIELKAPLHLTWSCYENEAVPCGKCDSCALRARGFEQAGVRDSILS